MVDLSLIAPPSLWYVVGLITTDGNLSPDGRHITLVSKDRPLLKTIREALFLKNKIGLKGRGGDKNQKIYSVLHIGDRKFYDYLLQLGLMPRKSLRLGTMRIPDEYFVDFLRGIIDGDGSIQTWIHRTNKNRQWSLRIISGAPIFAHWLKEKIEVAFRVKGKLYSRIDKGKKNPIYNIKFGKFASKIVLNACYYHNCLALNRKAKRAIQCIRAEDGLHRYGDKVENWARVSKLVADADLRSAAL